MKPNGNGCSDRCTFTNCLLKFFISYSVMGFAQGKFWVNKASDGDIEFPAGFYKAGTILDNDVQFNTKATATNGLRFTVGDLVLDTNVNSVDLIAVAPHEFDHSHGLSHVIDNQISGTDGSASAMVTLVDAGDPASEKARRSLTENFQGRILNS
jgi:hypothetical protein